MRQDLSTALCTNWLFAAAGLTLVLLPLQHVFATVPALHGKTEARSADLKVRPAVNALGRQNREHARALGEELPTAVRLFADEAVTGSRISVAIGAAFGDDGLWLAIPIEVPDILDRTRRIGGCWVVTSLPPLALEREASGFERRGLVRR